MRRFLDAQSGEKPQLHDARLIRILLGEPLERLIHSQHFGRNRVRRHINSSNVQGDFCYRAASFQGVTASRMVHQDSSHEVCGDCKKLSPILPRRVTLIDELQKDFMNECGRLKRVIRPLAPQLASGDAPKFRVDQRGEPIQRRLVAAPPLRQHLCNCL